MKTGGMKKLILRDAERGELPYIRSQRIHAYEEHKESISGEHWQALKTAISSDADAVCQVELIVAELEGKIVGSVALYPPKMDAYKGMVEELDYPEIRMLAVTPDARGDGIATALISECIQRSKLNGYKSIGLHTADFMKSALKLYERMGFERLAQYDFEPANDGIIVKAFRLPLN